MTLTKSQLIKEICKREKKKSSVSIGNVREIISILEDICAEWHIEDGTQLGLNNFLPFPFEALDYPLYASVYKKFCNLKCTKTKKKKAK